MAYHGWDRDHMLRSGNATGVLPKTTGFNPINYNQAKLRPPSPLDPVGRGLDRDSLYQLRDDTIPKTSIKSLKKRNPPSSKGRAVSLGRVWEYEDEEDIYNNGTTIEEPVPKRKKATISSRSQSMKFPPLQGAGIRDDEDENRVDHEEQAAQLTMPIDSGKRNKDKFVLPAPKSKGKQMPPFKNPTITKQSISREKETTSSKPITSHHGWRSTEDSVKSTPVVLAKTTMEKLAAFRFKAPPEPQPPQLYHPAPRNTKSEKISPDQQHKPLQEAVQASSDSNFPESDPLFDEALWAIKMHTKSCSNDHLHAKLVTTASTVSRSAREITSYQERPNLLPKVLEPEKGKSFKSSSHDTPILTKYLAKDQAYTLESSQETNSFYVPTSSGARFFDNVPNIAKPSPGNLAQSVFSVMDTNSNETGVPRSQGIEARNVIREYYDVVDDYQNFQDQPFSTRKFVQETFAESGMLAELPTHHNKTIEVHNGQIRHMPQADQNAACPRNESDNRPQPNCQIATYQIHAKLSADIQSQQSEIVGPEIVSKEASRDLWVMDEFDQGLDDDDFLAMIPENVIPQTPAKPQTDQSKNLRICGRFLLPSIPAGPVSLTLPKSSTKDIIGSTCSSQLTPDFDNEYAMDDGDEQEVLKLLELGATVRERFLPSESIQRAFDDRADGEVYDSSLQFSSPKSQVSGVSPSQVTFHHIDKNRASQAREPRKNSPVCEEEDWSFVRSVEGPENFKAQIMSEPFYSPQETELRRNGSCQTLPTPSKRSVADHSSIQTPSIEIASKSRAILDDSHEYEPMNPFARPNFPSLILDHSPVVGFSAQTYLRTCFRIGEMFREGGRSSSLGHDAVIELFARVTFSSREMSSTKQHFQFADLWHDRPPYPNGLLANYKTAGLAESESKVFLSENGKIARCLGRLKKDSKNVWVLHIINIRETDWEEIRWTKEIIGHGQR